MAHATSIRPHQGVVVKWSHVNDNGERERETEVQCVCGGSQSLTLVNSAEMVSRQANTHSSTNGKMYPILCWEILPLPVISFAYLLKWSIIRSSRMFSGKFPTQRCRVSLTIVVCICYGLHCLVFAVVVDCDFVWCGICITKSNVG